MNSFNKIIGYESVKNELYQIIDMYKNKKMYERMGARLPKGILIFGNPGMGKSMLANAFIKECNVKSFLLNKNKDDNETINEIRSIFSEAAKEENAIILIDDIDKFSEINNEDVDDKAFVAIQAAIDSVKNKNVLVIATANNYRKLPTSLKRKGRFDRKIELQSPTNDDARKIIEYYMKSKCVNKNINYDDVAKMINYTSCAALESIINESAIYAAYQRKESIDIDDIAKAYLRDCYTSPDENYKCSKEEIEVTALHEAGHAAIAEILKEGCVGFVCIQTTGRNNSDGSTHLCDVLKRRPENILVALGGKVAVELNYEGKCASGCQSDLAKAAALIRDGVNDSGTCGLGAILVNNDKTDYPSIFANASSEAITHAELERYMFIARDILIKNKDFLMKLKEKLEKKHILLYSDIKEIRNSAKIINITIQ